MKYVSYSESIRSFVRKAQRLVGNLTQREAKMTTSEPNSIAAVTGAGSGIGQAIARRLASDGMHVAVLEREIESGQTTADQIASDGGSAEVVGCDVSDLDQVRTAFSSIGGGSGRVDVLVNNAGVSAVGNVIDTQPEEMDRLFQINVKGVYHCLHVAIPGMIERGGGVVLNLASVASKIGLADRFAYSMTKGAVLSMTLNVARDFVDQGIRCNCICPARVHTPFVDGYLEKNYPEDEREAMFKTLSDWQPIGRMAKPAEIAALASFLCSNDASFITGSAYDIDGGATRLR